jgi:hypothetical protein
MNMNRLIILLLLAAPLAQAEIYRCDSPDGPVFSDKPCGDQAEIITVQDSSAGINTGPSEETRAYLAQKRDERAQARKQASLNRPPAPSAPARAVEPYGQQVYPGYWGGDLYPNRPGRPPRPDHPDLLPEPPRLPDGGDGVLRPAGGGR